MKKQEQYNYKCKNYLSIAGFISLTMCVIFDIFFVCSLCLILITGTISDKRGMYWFASVLIIIGVALHISSQFYVSTHYFYESKCTVKYPLAIFLRKRTIPYSEIWNIVCGTVIETRLQIYSDGKKYKAVIGNDKYMFTSCIIRSRAKRLQIIEFLHSKGIPIELSKTFKKDKEVLRILSQPPKPIKSFKETVREI